MKAVSRVSDLWIQSELWNSAPVLIGHRASHEVAVAAAKPTHRRNCAPLSDRERGCGLLFTRCAAGGLGGPSPAMYHSRLGGWSRIKYWHGIPAWNCRCFKLTYCSTSRRRRRCRPSDCRIIACLACVPGGGAALHPRLTTDRLSACDRRTKSIHFRGAARGTKTTPRREARAAKRPVGRPVPHRGVLACRAALNRRRMVGGAHLMRLWAPDPLNFVHHRSIPFIAYTACRYTAHRLAPAPTLLAWATPRTISTTPTP